MKKLTASGKALIPFAIYLIAVIAIGCGGAGGGSSSSGGATGGSSGGGTSGGGTSGGGGGGTGGSGGTGGFAAGEVYFASDMDGGLRIYKVGADGTGLVPVSTQPDVAAPCVSWDGTSIAYEQWSLYGSVFKMGSDGTNPSLVYAPELDCLNPAFSPDNTEVVFSLNLGGVPQLYRTTSDGANLTELTTEQDGVAWGRYSPDGSKIVYVTHYGQVDIKLMNSDGSGVQTVASDAAIQDMPMWSPDGTKIVFMQNFGSDFSPNYQIMVVDASGGTPARLTNSTQDDRSPCFSEDGAHVLFTRRTGEFRNIFSVSASGGTATQVTNLQAWTGWLSAKRLP